MIKENGWVLRFCDNYFMIFIIFWDFLYISNYIKYKEFGERGEGIYFYNYGCVFNVYGELVCVLI